MTWSNTAVTLREGRGWARVAGDVWEMRQQHVHSIGKDLRTPPIQDARRAPPFYKWFRVCLRPLLSSLVSSRPSRWRQSAHEHNAAQQPPSISTQHSPMGNHGQTFRRCCKWKRLKTLTSNTALCAKRQTSRSCMLSVSSMKHVYCFGESWAPDLLSTGTFWVWAWVQG